MSASPAHPRRLARARGYPIGLPTLVPLLLLASAPAAAAPGTSTTAKSLLAQPVEADRIRVDGRLDEPAWATAEVGEDFVERVPLPGERPPVRTEVRILVGPSALYVGVTAHLLPGERPRALELRRDNFGIFSDDAISVKIDVRRDARTTLGFVTNPNGAELDYVSVENASAFRREFDAIWSVAATVEADRWTAEFELPTVALGLPDVDGGEELRRRVVGLNVTRDHNARLATYDWSAIPAEFGPTAALFYGELLGLDALGGGRPLSLIPYVLGAYESGGDPEYRARAGGDVRLRLADDVWGELTLFTDFAQVDLDDPAVNLDRFPLFFPERRPFFLSGTEFFEFGEPRQAQIYFSRRIGIDADGAAIPLLVGGKSYGTAGDFRFGALGSLTEQRGERPAQTYSVLRARQNFGESGHLGLIGTLRTDVGALSSGPTPIAPSVTAGVDGALRGFSRRLEAAGFFALTTPETRDDRLGLAGQASLQYRGYELQPRVSVLVVSPDFDPAVGFVRRTDQIGTSVALPWVTRTTQYGLQAITVTARADVVQGYADGRVETQTGSAELDVLLRSGVGVALQVQGKSDLVREATEVAGFDVAPGLYRGALFVAGLRTSGGRNPSGGLTYAYNTGFFDGTAHTLTGYAEGRLGPHVILNATADAGLLELPGQGRRETLAASGSVTWALDTRVLLDVIVQAQNLEERVTALARLRWRYLPGSDLFLVYREDVRWGEEGDDARSLTLRVGYRWDALL